MIEIPGRNRMVNTSLRENDQEILIMNTAWKLTENKTVRTSLGTYLVKSVRYRQERDSYDYNDKGVAVVEKV